LPDIETRIGITIVRTNGQRIKASATWTQIINHLKKGRTVTSAGRPLSLSSAQATLRLLEQSHITPVEIIRTRPDEPVRMILAEPQPVTQPTTTKPTIETTGVLPDPVTNSRRFQIKFVDVPFSNFFANLSVDDFRKLLSESSNDDRWSVSALEKSSAQPDFTFEMVIGFIDTAIGETPRTTTMGKFKGDIFTSLIVGLVGLGAVVGLTKKFGGGKKK